LDYTHRSIFAKYPFGLKKRKIEIAVISDVHLGTYGCHAEELLVYLSSIKPKTLILNGDIVDAWHFSKKYFPPSHFKVLKKIFSMASNGTEVYYICGNHDEVLRQFNNQSMGNFHIRNKLLLELDGRKAWIFHGDVFDLSARRTKWVARLGGKGYTMLLRLNRSANKLLARFGKEKISLAKRIRDGVTSSKPYAEDFQKTVTDLAIRNHYDYVICGHLHQPKKQWIETTGGKSLYLNSGDWVENLTSLEYNFKRWKLYKYNEDKLSPFFADEDLKEMDIDDLISTITELQDTGEKPGDSGKALKEEKEIEGSSGE
jgi:UDP-2,3-diacylglucosamine pyrophosphatase LpxH